jgi:hypothetical protein
VKENQQMWVVMETNKSVQQKKVPTVLEASKVRAIPRRTLGCIKARVQVKVPARRSPLSQTSQIYLKVTIKNSNHHTRMSHRGKLCPPPCLNYFISSVDLIHSILPSLFIGRQAFCTRRASVGEADRPVLGRSVA